MSLVLDWKIAVLRLSNLNELRMSLVLDWKITVLRLSNLKELRGAFS